MKSHLHSIIVGMAILVGVGMLSRAYLHRNDYTQTIAVTGLGTLDFEADLITWSVSISGYGTDRKAAYESLSDARASIEEFLQSRGFAKDSYVVDAARMNQINEPIYANGQYVGSRISGYEVAQRISIESNKINAVEDISREVSDLMTKGIQLYSEAPQYFYTKLSDLKISLISSATEDGRKRAEQMAVQSGASLGKLKSARLGVFQITAQNTNEDFSWGGAFNTTSRYKTASVTTRLEFSID